MKISKKLKFILYVLILILIALLIAIFVYYKYIFGDIFRIEVFNEATSQQQLYEKLEAMCKSHDGEKYNSCSRSPLCGTENDSKSNDDRVNIYDNFLEDVGDTDDSPQSCMGDGSGRSKGCGGEYVPLCCYAMAQTGDPLKCVGYWERLWCPNVLCDEIDSDKAEPCGGGKCQCGHAFGTYCKEDGPTPAGRILTLCERLKREGVTGIVCASDITPTPTPTPTITPPPTVTPIVSITPPASIPPTPTNTPIASALKCSSFNYTDIAGNRMGPEQTVNDQQTVNLTLFGEDQTGKPSRLDICWSLAGQTNDYYLLTANWACEEFSAPNPVTGSNNAAMATMTNKNISYFMQKLLNLSQTQVRDYGLVFITRVYSNAGTNYYCSTNPAYNNGSGVLVDLTKQDISQKFVNSTCGLGSVGIETAKSCTLKLMYLPPGQVVGTSYDLNNDGKINIADFIIFVSYYQTRDLKIDYNKNANVDIEDFVYFKTEYVKGFPSGT